MTSPSDDKRPGSTATDSLRAQVGDALMAIRQSIPHMAAGFLAGGTAALLSNPLDVVKTRIQTQKGNEARAFFTCLCDIMRQEGLRKSMLRGILPKLMSTGPLGAVSSVVYESVLFVSRKDRNPKGVAAEEGAGGRQAK
jgi:hypothetical protein